jgi:hypothetical protein
MKKNQLFAACFFALALGTVTAQNAPAAAPKVPKMQTNPRLKTLQMAGDMVQYGLVKKQPLLLVSAAQILMENPVGDFKIEKEEQAKEAEATTGKTTKSAQNIDFTPKALLAKAKELANGDATVLAAIQKVETMKAPEVFGGALGGATYASRRINGNSRATLSCTYVGGRYAEMYLKGDGDSDLDFLLYDAYGNLVDSDTDSSDSAHFVWYANQTMTYRVVVVNHGSVYNVLGIWTN